MRCIILPLSLALAACGPSLDQKFDQTIEESIAATNDPAEKENFRRILRHKELMTDDQKQQMVDMWAELKSRRSNLEENISEARDSGEMPAGEANEMLENLAN